MKKPVLISCLASLLLVLSLQDTACATNMKVGPILSPKNVIALNNPVLIAYLLRNDSLYDAEDVRSVFTIRDAVTNEIVFENETVTPFIAAYTAFTVYSQLSWLPQYAGRFRLSVDIVYSQDVIPGDNSRTVEFRVETPPAGIFEAYRYDMLLPYTQMYSLYGAFFLRVAPRSQLQWLNVVGWRGDSEAVWLGKNLPLPPKTDSFEYSTYISLEDMGLESGVKKDSITLSVVISDTTWNSVTDELLKQGYILKPDTFAVDDGAPPEFTPTPPIAAPTPQNYPSGPKLRETILRDSVPNIDLDSSRYNSTTIAGYAGDLNACVPASGANSMHWLERIEEALPNTVAHREKLKLLSEFCRRQNETGVRVHPFVRGKLHFVDSMKLPIRVKWQSYYSPKDTATIASPISRFGHTAENKTTVDSGKVEVSWIVQEVKDNEDVEVFYSWYDSAGNRKGSHAVTVSGAITDNDRVKGIFIVDDANQYSAGGTRQRYFDLDENADSRGPVLRNYPFGHAFIYGAFSESYDSTVTFIEEPGSVGRSPSPLPTLHVGVRDGILLIASLPPSNIRRSIRVVDVAGRVLAEFDVMGGQPMLEYDLRLTGLVRGTYFLSLIEEGTAVATGSFQY